MKTLEVLFTPAEFEALARRDLSRTACVVFDVLRATSTIVTALSNGAAALVPVAEISEALAWRARQPGVLLAGERNGLRIRGAQTGGADFDLGNSPREFTPDVVRGKTIVTTTTNGTRALRACAPAQTVLVGSFLNLAATARWLRQLAPENLLLVCSGTGEEEALEDSLAAGAMVSCFEADSAFFSPSAWRALELWREYKGNLNHAMKVSKNGRRLLSISELRVDVGLCLQQDVCGLVAELGRDGFIRTLADAAVIDVRSVI